MTLARTDPPTPIDEEDTEVDDEAQHESSAPSGTLADALNIALDDIIPETQGSEDDADPTINSSIPSLRASQAGKFQEQA